MSPRGQYGGPLSYPLSTNKKPNYYCTKRIGEDVQTGNKTLDVGVCPKCPIRKLQHEHSTNKKQGGNKEITTDKIVGARRSLRLSTQVNVYCELDEDVYTGADDDLDQEIQQVHLCVSS